MAKRILIYGFPFFLLLIETLMRKALGLNSEGLIGPALAAAGIATLLPLTTPHNRNNDYQILYFGGI